MLPCIYIHYYAEYWGKMQNKNYHRLWQMTKIKQEMQQKNTHTKTRMHKKFQRRKMNENEQAINITRLKALWDSKNAD